VEKFDLIATTQKNAKAKFYVAESKQTIQIFINHFKL